jgi:hypothetical protein
MASAGVHLLSGFAIGTLAPSRRVAFTGGIASHAVFDAVPHRDYVSWSANAIDTAVAVALAAVLAGRLPKERRVRAFLGAIGGVLPDMETIAFKAGSLPADRRVFPSHSGVIRHGRGGAASTAALSIASIVAASLAVRHSAEPAGLCNRFGERPNGRVSACASRRSFRGESSPGRAC